MSTWKTAAAFTAGVAATAVIGMFAVTAHGQADRREPDHEGAVRAFALADMFGARIGVAVREADERDVKEKPGVSLGSVLVDDVREESPAAEAGIHEGDVVLEFDGERVRSARQFRRLVEETPAGRSAPVVVSRDGKRVDLAVTPRAREFDGLLSERDFRWRAPEAPMLRALPKPREWELAPEIDIFRSRPGRLGVQIQTLTDQLASYFGVEQGVLVTSVDENSAASKAGFRAGDVITSIDGSAIEDAGGLRRRLNQIDEDREFAVEVTRDKKPVTLKARMDSPSSSRRRTRTERF